MRPWSAGFTHIWPATLASPTDTTLPIAGGRPPCWVSGARLLEGSLDVPDRFPPEPVTTGVWDSLALGAVPEASLGTLLLQLAVPALRSLCLGNTTLARVPALLSFILLVII